MGHFKDLEDLGLKTSVSVLGLRPGPRSELKTLDRLVTCDGDVMHLIASAPVKAGGAFIRLVSMVQRGVIESNNTNTSWPWIPLWS